MARPNVTQGPINRLIASVLFPSFPALNISPSYLTPEAIDWAPEGQATTMLPTLTGLVTSPEPYQMVRVTCHLIRSQSFADTWKQQQESSTLLGDCTVRPDSPTLSPYTLNNTAILGVDRMGFGGRDAGYVVTLSGFYSLNSSLWT